MNADEKLTKVYQFIENRRTEMDKMGAWPYSRLDPSTELRAVLSFIDKLDEET